MEWYLPMTIIPGVGLLILSTSNIMLALNNELSLLIKEKQQYQFIIQNKLKQLKRLSVSIVFQYIGVFLFLVSGIVKSIVESISMPKLFLLLGVLSISISIAVLIIYSIKAVSIRQERFNTKNRN